MDPRLRPLQQLLLDRQAAGAVLAMVDAFFRWGSGDVEEGERMMARDREANAALRRCEAALDGHVARLCREDPALLEAWVARNLALADHVEAETGSSLGWVATQREEWPRVLQGTQRWVYLRRAPVEDARVRAWFGLQAEASSAPS